MIDGDVRYMTMGKSLYLEQPVSEGAPAVTSGMSYSILVWNDPECKVYRDPAVLIIVSVDIFSYSITTYCII